MPLWPEEHESLREEARRVAAGLRDALVANRTGQGDDPDWVHTQRAMLATMRVESPAGRDEVIAGVPCRVFRPLGASRGTYLHFHGGAMIVGHPLDRDVANAGLCERLGVRVISVDYRLAPEHPYPAGPDDCFAVARWLLDDEAGALVVGGESSGGYLSALTLLRLRDELGASRRFAGANLVYGVFDLGGTPSARGSRPTDAPDMLDASAPDRVRPPYLPGRSREDARDPAISPLYADLQDMPPALFSVGFADHLLDDTLFMAARWQAFGAPTELAVYPDCGHAFDLFPTELTKRANERIDQFLDDAFNSTS
jgi:acetyl esterase